MTVPTNIALIELRDVVASATPQFINGSDVKDASQVYSSTSVAELVNGYDTHDFALEAGTYSWSVTAALNNSVASDLQIALQTDDQQVFGNQAFAFPLLGEIGTQDYLSLSLNAGPFTIVDDTETFHFVAMTTSGSVSVQAILVTLIKL